MASIPIGGRYRIIDFTLSNMVNAGMKNIGIFSDQKYRSLTDHLGNGSHWDLSLKMMDYLYLVLKIQQSRCIIL